MPKEGAAPILLKALRSAARLRRRANLSNMTCLLVLPPFFFSCFVFFCLSNLISPVFARFHIGALHCRSEYCRYQVLGQTRAETHSAHKLLAEWNPPSGLAPEQHSGDRKQGFRTRFSLISFSYPPSYVFSCDICRASRWTRWN